MRLSVTPSLVKGVHRTAAKLVQVSGVLAPLTGYRSYTAGKSLCVCNGTAADGSTTSAVVAVRPCGIAYRDIAEEVAKEKQTCQTVDRHTGPR
ncbi:hypothetical protein CDEST_02841 [Colletotrichum destructivum]|uniref:Uncharacterized protein n=1 Tax=Colletotrichum destructivum TaxID=34406 RepID=A0AAX4I3E1_9PEZI|nr:hypothetical protein CDEST_02841 [Colletotrichum destructivum]